MNFVTATGSSCAGKLNITFCNKTKKFSKMYVDVFKDEINDELLNKICQYNVSYWEAETIFPRVGEIPQVLFVKNFDQFLTKKGT